MKRVRMLLRVSSGQQLEADGDLSVQRRILKEYIKVKYNKTTRRDIMEICDIMKADIVDMSQNLMIIQICDMPERIKVMLDMLKSISIVEVARTGTLALPKCTEF